MDGTIKNEIVAVEEKLKEAMRSSDVRVLDELLSSHLLFTNHLGQLVSKEADLAGHKSGDFKIEALEFSEQRIQLVGDLAAVSVLAKISGSYRGVPANGNFRFTRLWAKEGDRWQVVVGHSSSVV